MKVRVRERPKSDDMDVVLEDVGTGETVADIHIDVLHALTAAEYTVYRDGEPVADGTYNFQAWNEDRRQWMLEKILDDLNDDGVFEEWIEVQEWV